MSLAVVIKSVEGIVLAADSCVTVMGKISDAVSGNNFNTSYDNANKVFSFNSARNIGAITYGAAVIGNRTAQSFIFFLEKWRELYGDFQVSTYMVGWTKGNC